MCPDICFAHDIEQQLIGPIQTTKIRFDLKKSKIPNTVFFKYLQYFNLVLQKS